MGTMTRNLSLKRFDWVVQGSPVGPDPICDVPVLTTSDALVVPTIGAIVPDWLLVVPRTCTLSLAGATAEVRRSVLDLAEAVSLRVGRPEKTVYFEHGPATSGSTVGCGVDQAHLHVLNTEFNVLEMALADDSVDWSLTDGGDPWARLAGTEYYFIQSNGRAYMGSPRVPQSQYFRKHIACAAGVPWQWDYKLWPNYENVRRTYERFCGLEAAVKSA